MSWEDCELYIKDTFPECGC